MRRSPIWVLATQKSDVLGKRVVQSVLCFKSGSTYLHMVDNEEINDLYSSSNIVRVIKSRRMRWAGRVAHMGERTGVYRVLGNLKEETT